MVLAGCVFLLCFSWRRAADYLVACSGFAAVEVVRSRRIQNTIRFVVGGVPRTSRVLQVPRMASCQFPSVRVRHLHHRRRTHANHHHAIVTDSSSLALPVLEKLPLQHGKWYTIKKMNKTHPERKGTGISIFCYIQKVYKL